MSVRSKLAYTLLAIASLFLTPIYAVARLLGENTWTKLITYTYDHLSAYYDELAKLLPGYMDALEKTFEAASPIDGQIVLDAGCGTGLLTTMLASRKAEVVAIDVSAGQLRQLRKKYDATITIIHLIQADVTKLPIRDNAFDLAVSAGALSEIANPQLAIEEIIRTTKPNGKITLLVYAKKRETIFDPWAFTAYKLYRMLKEAHSHLEKLLYLDPYYILFIFSKKT